MRNLLPLVSLPHPTHSKLHTNTRIQKCHFGDSGHSSRGWSSKSYRVPGKILISQSLRHQLPELGLSQPEVVPAVLSEQLGWNGDVELSWHRPKPLGAGLAGCLTPTTLLFGTGTFDFAAYLDDGQSYIESCPAVWPNKPTAPLKALEIMLLPQRIIVCLQHTFFSP